MLLLYIPMSRIAWKCAGWHMPKGNCIVTSGRQIRILFPLPSEVCCPDIYGRQKSIMGHGVMLPECGETSLNDTWPARVRLRTGMQCM